MNPGNPAPENSYSRSSTVLRVDRFALKTIVKDEAIIAALVETHFSINGIYNTDLLLECLLERIFDLVPNAGSGVVLFAGQKPEQLDPVATRGTLPQVHAAIAAQVLRDRVAVLSPDDGSILCVPLRVFDMNYGVIYLHSPETEAFTTPEFYLLIAIGCISAIAVGHARYVERLESENQRLHREVEKVDIAQSIIPHRYKVRLRLQAGCPAVRWRCAADKPAASLVRRHIRRTLRSVACRHHYRHTHHGRGPLDIKDPALNPRAHSEFEFPPPHRLCFLHFHVDGTPVPLTLPSPDQWRRATVPPIELSPGQVKWDMVVRLTPVAIVRGRIRDSAGQPLAALRIELQRRRYTATGILTFQIAAAVSSDELGRFRFEAIPTGRYYVAAGVSVPVSIYAYTYFPGVTEVEKAAVIDVQPGSDWSAIDFTVGSQKLFRVRGRVMDSRTGQPPPQATINIYSTSPVNPYLSYGSADYDAASGAFERTGLPPGTYRFSAVPQLVLTSPGLTAGPGGVSRPSGTATVQIAESDVNDQLLVISEAPVITGRISVEGSRPTSTTLTQSGPQLRSSQGGGALPTFPSTSSSSVTTDGVLRLLTIADGEFVVTMSFLPDGLYLKQARLNGADVRSLLPFPSPAIFRSW